MPPPLFSIILMFLENTYTYEINLRHFGNEQTYHISLQYPSNNLPLQVPPPVQDILYLTACLNSCINPFIYGVYYYSEKTSTNRGSCCR